MSPKGHPPFFSIRIPNGLLDCGEELRGEENVGHGECGGEEGCNLSDGVARLVVADLADVESHLGMRLGMGDERLDAGLDLGETASDGGDGVSGGGVTREERGTGLEPAVFGRLSLFILVSDKYTKNGIVLSRELIHATC